MCYLDAADEKGILIVDETAIYGSGKSMDAANEKIIKNCKEHIHRRSYFGVLKTKFAGLTDATPLSCIFPK